eukprot:SAG31_NODE_7420_length_1693_cov_1.743413_2_plen_87_part_00
MATAARISSPVGTASGIFWPAGARTQRCPDGSEQSHPSFKLSSRQPKQQLWTSPMKRRNAAHQKYPANRVEAHRVFVPILSGGEVS